MKLPFRHGIVKYESDMYGNQLFLQETVSGVSLVASNTPLVVTIANGTHDYLHAEKETVTNAWVGPFAAGTDYWLYIDIHPVSAMRTFGFTELAPVAGHVAPSSPANTQHWFDLTTNTMKVYNGSMWTPAIRIFITKYESATDFANMSSDTGLTYIGTQVGLNVPCYPGYLVWDTNGRPLKAGKDFFTTADSFVSGIPTAASIRLQALPVEGVAQNNMSAFTIVKFSDFNDIVPASPTDLENDIVFGIIEEGVTTGEVTEIFMEGVISNDAWDWTLPNKPLYIDDTTKQLTETPSLPPIPVATVIDRQTIVLRAARLSVNLDALYAADVSYNNAGSGLSATKVQQAIDELTARIIALETP